MMPWRVVVTRRTGKDDFGNPTFDAPFEWPCRRETNRRRFGVLDKSGTVLHATVREQSLIGPYMDPEFGPGDRFTLPTGISHTIGDASDINIVEDEHGPYYVEVTLKEA